MSEQPGSPRYSIDDWVRKAEQDYRAAAKLAPDDTPDVVCFLCHQCVEKYLKALITRAGSEPGRTHDLIGLIEQLQDGGGLRGEAISALDVLDGFAVVVRYPGAYADEEDARGALAAVRIMRNAARRLLRLDDEEHDEDDDV